MADNTTQDQGDVAHTEVAHESGGMPQLDFDTFGNQIFWLVICLVAVYVILSRIAMPRIGEVLEQRSQTIQRDLDRAAEMKDKAKEAEENYHIALNEARAEAQKIAEATKAEIQVDLDKATAKADAEIEAKSLESAQRISQMQADADKSVTEIARDVVASIVERVSPASADDKAVEKALKEATKG